MTKNDPIEAIKKAEAAQKAKVEKARKDYEEGLAEIKGKLEQKRVDFEEDLRSEGTEKLEKVKIEASELLKSRMTASQKHLGKLSEEARSRKDQAVKEVTRIFLEQIKS